MEAKAKTSLESISTNGRSDQRRESNPLPPPPKTPQREVPSTPLTAQHQQQQKQQQVVDSAVLDNIHANSATSPSLTTFSLGSPSSTNDPPPAVAPEAGLNRIYTLVRGVVDGVTGKDAATSSGKEKEKEKDKDKEISGVPPASSSHHEEVGSLNSSTYSFPNYSTSSSRITSPTAKTGPLNAGSTTNPPSPVLKRIQPAVGSAGDGAAAEPIMQRKASASRRGPSLDIFAPLAATSTVLGTATVGLTTLEPTLPSEMLLPPPSRELDMPRKEVDDEREEVLSPTSEVAGGAGVFVEAENPKSPNVLSEDDKFYEDLDDDNGSEILTDEEEEVVGKGGYLGKVAGMKKTDDREEYEDEATPKAKLKRQSSAAPSAIQSPVVPSFAEAIVQATVPSSIASKVNTPGGSPLLSRTHSIPTSPRVALTSPAIPLDSPTKGYFQPRSPAPSNHTAASIQNELTSHGVGFGRSAANRNNISSEANVDAALRQLRRGQLTRDFWMKDENFKECFLCNRMFNTWRRKHHCRLCGYVFCSKCTTHINGARFGYSGSMRVCNSCLDIVKDYRSEASDSDVPGSSNPVTSRDGYASGPDRKTAGRAFDMPKDHRPKATPLMAIPATRTKLPIGGDRRSAILEFNNDLPSPSRPSSARSNRPMTGMRHNHPHGHHHHHGIRHQHSRSGRWSYVFNNTPSSVEERAPFQKRPEESPVGPFKKDSIIDPELAPYMSDEDAEEENQHVGIFATIAPTIQPANIAQGVKDVMEADDESEPKAGGVPMQRNQNRSKSPVRPLVSPENSPIRAARKRNPNLSGTISSRSPRKSARNLGRAFDTMGSPSPNSSSPNGVNSKISPVRSASIRGPHMPVVELNSASLSHVKRLLRQLLRSAKIENASAWEGALIPILLKCTDDLNPDVRGGDAIDLRHFCKVKRIPGGKPADTTYVPGLVFSKNLALKGMPRQIMHPKIAVAAFPIEYHKQQSSFMSLEPVIAQEKEYLQNTVNRIIALEPTLLLVEKNVSGLALEYLYAAGIATAVSVKPSVIEAVARCAEADIIFSAEETALKTHRVGKCDSFEIKTYVHPDIPTRNNRKSFMYLNGCQKELGCTIVLRGDRMDTLAKVKRITEFMVYVVYNLKLETCLMRDQFALIPAKFRVGSLDTSDPKERQSIAAKAHGSDNDTQKTDKEKAESTSEKTEGDEKASTLTSIQAPSTAAFSLDEYPEDLPPPNYYGAYLKEHESTILSASPFVKFAQPYQLVRARNYERRLEWMRRLCEEDRIWEENERKKAEERKDSEKKEEEEPFQLITPEMLHTPAASNNKKFRELLKAVHEIEYDKALHAYKTQKKSWELYLSQNDHLFDPTEHQEITTLYSMISSQTSVPCRGPEMIMFEFYNDNYPNDDEYKDKDYYREPDCSLGQYIEDLVRTKNYMCESGCEKRMIDHHRSYVHGEARVSVHVQEFKCPLRNMQNQILMWSYCKICKNQLATPVMPMSECTWKYSFGKYLELSIWSQPIGMRAEGCPHDLHRDHVRYFGFQDYAVRFEFDSIDLMEVYTPRSRVTWKPELDTNMKNQIYNIMYDRINKFWDSVVARLKSINVESVDPEKLDACKEEIAALLVKAEDEREWVVNKLRDKYTNSKYFEVLPLNRAMRAMQERVVDWDQDFADFDLNYFPSEKDIRRMAALQLRKMFLDRDSSSSTLPTETDTSTIGDSTIGDKDTSEFPSEETIPVMQTPTADEAHTLLSSVMEENAGKITPSPPTDSLTVPSEVSLVGSSNASETTTEAPPTPTPIDNASEASQSLENSIISTVPESNASETNLDSSTELSPTQEKEPQIPTLQESASNPELGVVQTKDYEPSAMSPSQPPQPIGPIKDIVSKPSKPSAAARERALQNPRSNLPTATRKSMMPTNLLRTNSSPSSIPKTSDTGVGPSTRSVSGEKRNSIGSKTSEKSKRSEKSKFEKKVDKVKEFGRQEKIKLPDRLRQVSVVLGGSKKAASSSQIPVPRLYPDKKKVSSLAKHFEELSREFQKERESKERKRLAARRSRALPVASSRPIVEVYKNVEQAVQAMSDDEKEDEPIKQPERKQKKEEPVLAEPPPVEAMDIPPMEATITPEREPDSTPQTMEEPVIPQDAVGEDVGDASDTEFSLLSDNESVKIPPEVAEVLTTPGDEIPSELKLEAELPKHERTSLMKLLSNFWSERSASGWAPLEYPLQPSDHVFADSDVIVREDEPSSLIAFALNCNDYSSKLESMHSAVDESLRNDLTESPDFDPNVLLDESYVNEQAMKMSLLSEKGTHLKYQFQEGSAKMFCKIFFAEQFDALRRRCGVADRYVESLSRCIKWDSKGGKTRSVFLKTLDDRIVLKQLSQVETTAFLKFAPSYFHIMSEALFRELPTAIAKMLGFYQIYIKNSLTGTEIKWDILVMENLFYDRKMSRIFDLKGSMRNRYTQETGEQNEVLLDENMVEFIFENPLFIREASKKLLRVSLWNDTLFLERNQVMDYSLMIGIDDERKELVVGLIDCVRTYTFDKRLENLIKASGIAGGGRNRPTITSPKEYKRRFREAMERYILEAPNCWRQSSTRLTWIKSVGIPLARGQADDAQTRRIQELN